MTQSLQKLICYAMKLNILSNSNSYSLKKKMFIERLTQILIVTLFIKTKPETTQITNHK